MIFYHFFSVNGQYAKQGKLGAAVLGNHAAKDVSLDLLTFVMSVALK